MKKKLDIIKGLIIRNKIRYVIVALAVVAFGYYSYMYLHSYLVDIFVSKSPKEAIVKANTIDSSKWNLHLTSATPEKEVIQDMHEMTHQKIEAAQKWGAIPIIPDTINQVYNCIISSDFKHKSELLDMVKRWQKGDFTYIASDHNYLWGLEGGTVGKATGNATPEEEAQYILENFGGKVK